MRCKMAEHQIIPPRTDPAYRLLYSQYEAMKRERDDLAWKVRDLTEQNALIMLGECPCLKCARIAKAVLHPKQQPKLLEAGE